MSTRAHIRIYDEGGFIQLYHHCDGYPNGIGKDLKSVLHQICLYPDYGARDLIQNNLGLNDKAYMPTTCIHGDEEYVYVIDTRDKTIKCFQHYLDETFEECFKAEREIPIPD